MSTNNCHRCAHDLTGHVCAVLEGEAAGSVRDVGRWCRAQTLDLDGMPPLDTPSPCPGFTPREPETPATSGATPVSPPSHFPQTLDALAKAKAEEAEVRENAERVARMLRGLSYASAARLGWDTPSLAESIDSLLFLASRLRAELNEAQDTVRHLHNERADLVRASSGKMPTGPENATWSLARQVYEDRLALAAYAADAAKARKLAADGAPHEDIRAALRSHGPYAVAGAIDGVDNVHDIVKDCARLRGERDEARRERGEARAALSRGPA